MAVLRAALRVESRLVLRVAFLRKPHLDELPRVPAVLILAGAYLALRLRFFYILHPVKFVRELKKSGGRDGTSPFKALSMALAVSIFRLLRAFSKR